VCPSNFAGILSFKSSVFVRAARDIQNERQRETDTSIAAAATMACRSIQHFRLSSFMVMDLQVCSLVYVHGNLFF
jgi:hypothetical protein